MGQGQRAEEGCNTRRRCRRQSVAACPLRQAAPLAAGERRCLACGRAFRDIQRFAQHLKDAHGGRNSATPIQQQPALPAAGGAGGGGSAWPGLRAAVQLGDMLLKAAPASRGSLRAAAPQQIQREQRQHAQKQQPQQQQQQQAPVAARPAASRAAAAAALAPPPGTRAKAGKRESRLKRAFKRSRASQACSRWQGVLAGAAGPDCCGDT